MEHAKTPCRHRRLAHTALCRVDYCDRGTVHLSLGDLTLRMKEAQFVELAEALGLAAGSLATSALDERRLLC